jgi:chemotaxis protein MotB
MSKGGEEIRVIKRKKSEHGHHGGAWKVAYADFVTAMMAFFLVMWLIGLNQEIKKAIAGYFRDPSSFLESQPQSEVPFDIGQDLAAGKKSDQTDTLTNLVQKAKKDQQKAQFQEIQKQLENSLSNIPELSRLREHVQIQVVDDGLRIELIEGPEPVFFVTGSAQVMPAAHRLMVLIAREVRKLDNKVIIEGHTDSRPYKYGKLYGNWELSSDRANAARRILENGGLWKGQVAEVRGYADMRLRLPKEPLHYSNRRVSLLIPYKK